MAEFIVSEVLSKNILDGDHFILEVSHKDTQAYPGQFYMIRSWGDFPVLARPISVFDKKEDSVFFFIRKKGEGTRLLYDLKVGEKLYLNGPLGNGYNKCDEFLAIGAGMGFASIHFAIRKFALDCVYGISDSSALFDFNKIEKVKICTEDGSHGFCGNLIEYLKENYDSSKYKGIIACGPDVFLDLLLKFAEEKKINIKLSYEERMGCGFGLCMSCKKEINGNSYHLCKDGPVIDIEFS